MDLLDVLYTPSAERNWSFPLPSHPLAVKQARILISTALTDWGLDIAEDSALLVGSELVTNALKHGEGADFKIEFFNHGAVILIEVTDSALGTPILMNVEASADSGRGLWLVDGVSQAWGVRYNADETKTVWAKVAK